MNEVRHDSTWQVGDIIGNRFIIHEILGGEKGGSGYGIVYKCYLAEHEKLYALKTYQDRYKANEEFKKNFEKEANFWTNLPNHPNIVRSRWVEKLEDRLFLVLEYIPTNEQDSDPSKKRRNTLAYYLNDLSYEQILSISLQFCSGMDHAYQNNLIAHCDIKPDNIMITPEMVVKITDFGISRSFFEAEKSLNFSDKNSADQRVVMDYHGAPPYSAPEMFYGIADHRSDIYSFGIVLYQMVSKNQYPYGVFNSFTAKDLYIEYFKRVHHEGKVIPVKSPLNQIIEICLEKDQSKRYQSITELQTALKYQYKKCTGTKWIPSKTEDSPVIDKAYAGLSMAALGDKDKAIRLLDESIQAESSNYKLWYIKGLGLFYLKEYDESLSCFQKALKLNSENEAIWYMAGTSCFHSNRFIEAIPFFQTSLKMKEKNPEAYTYLGDIMHQVELGNTDKAIAYYDRAIDIDNKFIQPHIRKAEIYESYKKLDLAIDSYKKILEIDNRLNIFKFRLGIALIDSGKPTEGVQILNEYLGVVTNDIMAVFYVGLGYYQLNEYEKSILFFTRAINSNPDRIIMLECLNRKTVCLIKLDMVDVAIETNKAALLLYPESEETNYIKSLLDDFINSKE